MTTTLRVNCQDFAVAANNALAFIPANSTIRVARTRLTGDVVDFMGTDTYAAGCSTVSVERLTGPDFVVLMSRDALTDLERTARAGKKFEGEFAMSPGVGWSFRVLDNVSEPIQYTDITDANRVHLEVFDAIDEMLEPEQQFRTAFQPMLLQRFSKVKADKDQRVADVAIDDPDRPVLFKIGTDFRGLVMPVNRSAHAELIGEEGLW